MLPPRQCGHGWCRSAIAAEASPEHHAEAGVGSGGPGSSTGISAELLGSRAFDRPIGRDVEALTAHATTTGGRVVTEEMLEGLPEPVQRYLAYAGIVGRPLVRTVQLEQRGGCDPVRASPGCHSLPTSTTRCSRQDSSGMAPCRSARFPIARARDRYLDGRRGILVKAAALFTVVDAAGEALDSASTMRYLSEM